MRDQEVARRKLSLVMETVRLHAAPPDPPDTTGDPHTQSCNCPTHQPHHHHSNRCEQAPEPQR